VRRFSNSPAEVVFLTISEVKKFHERLISFGGLPGLRDDDLLASALGNVELMNQFGESDVFKMAAALAFSLAMNHPFLDEQL